MIKQALFLSLFFSTSLALADDGYLELPPEATPFKITTSQAIPSRTLQAMGKTISAGNTEHCVSTKLTVSGSFQDGSRLFVSAHPMEFSQSLRKAAKGTAKLSASQTHALQELVDYAQQSEKQQLSFSSSMVDTIAAQTRLQIESEVLCLQVKTFSAPRYFNPR